jgi:hypothetical protein
MANLGRKISGINTLTSFTAKVIYAASERYGETHNSVTFQVGREYSGKNFFKGSTRAPKLRILSVFQPLINGNPNTNNDTYVAFQVYDYTLNVWRGPWCKRNNPTDALTYVDYFITTIDSFGRKYGNQYTGSGSSVTTFTPPQVFLSTIVGIPINNSNGVIQINSDHNPSTFTLGGRDNKMYHFHGFITMDPYANGMWCFYSISANGQGAGFNHLLDTAPYNTNTYPNLLPNTNKFGSEWRVTTICNIFNNIGYSPRIRINNTGLGPIKYYPGPDPGNAFPVNNVLPTEVWCTYDPGNASTFFLTPLWSPGGNEGESAQGVVGSGADQYAPAGWYGTSAENSYAYWDGLGNWMPNSYATYSGAVTLTEYGIVGPYSDPMSACANGPSDKKGQVVYAERFDGDRSVLYSDSAGTMEYNAFPGQWYYSFDNGFVFMYSAGQGVQMATPC